MLKKKILCVIGTRPEAIKMAPVILALKREPWVQVKILATAQHREMLDQVMSYFNLTPDFDLNMMQPNQSLSGLTADLLHSLNKVLMADSPDFVLIQGDTTTVMTTSLACFYLKIPVGHIEAGLRTGDINNPFPEEANRIIVSNLAKLHFAPTQGAKANLVKEGIKDCEILVTGNTVIDALYITANRENDLISGVDYNKKIILITVHRRENFGGPLDNICLALRRLAVKNPEIQFLFPVHPNPNVHSVVSESLGEVSNIMLVNPLSYPQFITAMKMAYIILTDSGGVQEEAPALGKPVLVLRADTERPEAVLEGMVKLVGTNTEDLVIATQELLDNDLLYRSMSKGTSPYGDGMASLRITKALFDYFFNGGKLG